MSADPNRKSPRTFHCRDILWEAFEQMAKDLECSVDYLINESMKQYARSKNYGSRVAPSSIAPASIGAASPQIPQAPQPPSSPQGQQTHGATTAPSKATASRIPPPPPRGTSNVPPPRASRPPPMPSANRPALAPAVLTGSTLKGVAAANAVAPKKQPSSPNLAPKAASLTIIYKGEKFPVTKERFILGRGRQTSDLTLKDPNVSRQHAMIEMQNGTYFMVDMGSTNGVEFNGQRVARKPIAEGDVYTICDHELVCTYR